MPGMSKIEKYFASYQRRISEDFARVREIYSDSAVKGSNNEKIVSEFLSEHINCNFITNNNQIIDSSGLASDEVDICVCNHDQPFKTKTGELILCEGVDFVVQVKAVISNNELDRIIKNSKSVKKLNRQLTLGMSLRGHAGDAEYLVQRIPYIVFAFDSRTSIEALFIQLTNKLQDVELHLQPDAIFILNKGYLVNFRKGEGASVRANDTKLKGLTGFESAEYTLLEMIKYINHNIPKLTRNHNPLSYYQDSAGKEMVVYNKEIIKLNIIKLLQNVQQGEIDSLFKVLRHPNIKDGVDERVLVWATKFLTVSGAVFRSWTEEDWIILQAELNSARTKSL